MLNAAPLAAPDASYSTALDTALVVGSGNHPLVENDWDPEGAALTVSIVTQPASGALSGVGSSNGHFTYTPNTSFTGLDTFAYKVNDGTKDSSVVTASVAVGGHFGPQTNLQDRPRQGGALLTGALELAQELTPGLALVYNSTTLAKPIVIVETFLQSNSSVPDEVKAQLTFNGAAGTNYSYNTTGLAAGDALRFALQDSGTLPTDGRYAHTVTLAARFGANNVTRDYTGHTDVVNRSSSTHAFGRGWQLAGLDKLAIGTGGVLLVQSSGHALWFADDGAGGYQKAEGDPSFSTLVKNGDNTYTLTTR